MLFMVGSDEDWQEIIAENPEFWEAYKGFSRSHRLCRAAFVVENWLEMMAGLATEGFTDAVYCTCKEAWDDRKTRRENRK